MGEEMVGLGGLTWTGREQPRFAVPGSKKKALKHARSWGLGGLQTSRQVIASS